MLTRHLISKSIYDTPSMPRGSSYVLDSYIDMILSKNDAYAADAVCVTIITIKIRRYNVNKYRIKLKKIGDISQKFARKKTAPNRKLPLKNMRNVEYTGYMLSDQLKLFKCVIPDYCFIMFPEVGLAGRVPGQLFAIFRQDVA